MPKRGGLTNQDSNTAIQEIMPKVKAVRTSTFLLTSTNYNLWAMRKEVYLDAYGLWEVITGAETNQKNDRHALSVIDGELLPNMNTRVPNEPRYALRKRIHP